MILLQRTRLLDLSIHPDGNIWTVDGMESSGSRSLGMPPSRLCSPMRRPVATYAACDRDDAPAAPRQASLTVFVEINCFRPGDLRHYTGQGVPLPVATAHTGKLTAAALRGLATTGQKRCCSAPS
jgi:hypothetical protein